MKNTLLFLLGVILFSCSGDLDIKQDYNYSIKTLPVPKAIKAGDLVPLEFEIIRDAIYKNTSYSFRYFQSDGKGELTNDAGEHFAVNRFYPLQTDVFKLLYRSACSETQTLDFVFTDNFGKETEYKISFQNDSKN